MKRRTAVFIGHSKIYGNISERVSEEIVKLIELGVDTFLNGGMGDFDMICAKCVNELKNEYPHITHSLVIPYLHFNRCDRNIFDDSIYPELEKYNPRIAIVKRNEWLIKNADYALCYLEHPWGGAFKTYEKARKNGLEIINVGKL